MTIARVGEQAFPVVSADLVRVARLLRDSVEGSELADRIVAGLARNGELDLQPRSAAERAALEQALTELTWEEPRGRLLPRLRAAVAAVTVPPSLDEALTDDARTAADAYRTSRTRIKASREGVEAKKRR